MFTYLGLSLRWGTLVNFGLRMTAEAGRQQFGPEAANFLRDNFYVFYVDDG